MSALAKKHRLLVYEDIGSGALTDLSSIGLGDEPVVASSLRSGADIVTFSGDKLLGGPQAGIIAGRRKYVSALRKHPLYRALRVDKLTYAGIEATLQAHLRGTAASEVPTLRMLSMTKDEIGKRVDGFIKRLKRSGAKITGKPVDGISAVGGGAAPAVELQTVLISLTHASLRASELEAALRSAIPPVIGRVAHDKLLLDLRTVSEAEERELLETLKGV